MEDDDQTRKSPIPVPPVPDDLAGKRGLRSEGIPDYSPARLRRIPMSRESGNPPFPDSAGTGNRGPGTGNRGPAGGPGTPGISLPGSASACIITLSLRLPASLAVSGVQVGAGTRRSLWPRAAPAFWPGNEPGPPGPGLARLKFGTQASRSSSRLLKSRAAPGGASPGVQSLKHGQPPPRRPTASP